MLLIWPSDYRQILWLFLVLLENLLLYVTDYCIIVLYGILETNLQQVNHAGSSLQTEMQM